MNFLKAFKENVCRKSSKIAVRFGNESLTYNQLDLLSDSILELLNQQRVTKKTFVGILMDRSMDVLVALLGILKYGCGFVPIDTSYPNERINYVIADSNVECVICNNKKLLSTYSQCILYKAEMTPCRFECFEPDNAYMIYTSGSTGKPKGVIIGYDSLNNVLDSFSRILSMSDQDVFYAITTFSFDISILELLLPLYTGAEVVISNKRAQIDSIYLQKELVKNNVTLMQATPITWTMLLDSGWKNDNDIKILCGGEALTDKLAQRLLAISANVWNVYGPTETTIWSSAYKLIPNREVSIGTPIDNTYFLIFDEKKHIANEGELYIGGVGVSKGYWRRDKLNEEKFIQINGLRYYATGDLVRRDGDYFFYICRKDYQVKVNGHRIELGEIETIISKIPEIKETIVLYEKNKIVAFIKENSDIEDDKIINIISAFLPNYMIPQEIVRLVDFPLTDNNKVNRQKLCELVLDSPILENYDIYSQGLSSYEVMRLISHYAKRGYLLCVDDLFIGKTIKESLKISPQDKKFNDKKPNTDVWELQKQMALCRFFYPESTMYYEQCIIHLPSFSQDYLYNKLSLLFSVLDISHLESKYKGGSIYWKICDKLVVRKCHNVYSEILSKKLIDILIDEVSEVSIFYHHSLLDGESVQLLVELVYRYVNDEKIDINEYNGFIQANRQINDHCYQLSKHVDIPLLFDRDINIDNKIETFTRSFKYDSKSLCIKKFGGNLVPFLHYIISKALSLITSDSIVYGSVVSNRMYANSEKVLGNFINIITMFFSRSMLNSVDDFIKQYKNNMSCCKNVYNSQNKYQINVIINDLRHKRVYIDLINQKIVEMLPEYENNIFSINIRFNIMVDKIFLTISYKDVHNQGLLKTFFNNIENELCESFY